MSENDQDVTGSITLSKTNPPKGLVFGWASVIKKGDEVVVDREHDVITDEWELESAAYKFVASCRVGGDNHVRKGVSHLVESMVITSEKRELMGWPEDTPIGWWTGWKITDEEVLKGVVDGKYTGFSVHGKARRTPVEKAVKADRGFRATESMVGDALRADLDCYAYIDDLGTNWVAYTIEDHSIAAAVRQGGVPNVPPGTYKRSYSIGGDAKVTLGDPEAVRAVRSVQYVSKGHDALARWKAIK